MNKSFVSKLPPLLRSPGELEPNWLYFVARRNEEGELWAEIYSRPEHFEIPQILNRALRLLQKNQIEDGRRNLAEAHGRLQEIYKTFPDLGHVLGRWYFGTLAYYHYCLKDFASAEHTLDLAHDEVKQAIEHRRFLLPFARQCYDFSIQRIRIVRNQQKWSEMWRRVEITRRMAHGEIPYCILSDGTSVDLRMMQEFYRLLEPLDEEERFALRPIYDEGIRSRHLQINLSEAYALPGFVIPYLPYLRRT